MRLRPFIIAARLTPRQYEKISTVADVNGLTLSSVVGVLVDSLAERQDLLLPISDGAGVRQDSSSAVPF